MNDLIGQKFGRWTVLEKSDLSKVRHGTVWKCKCDCGNTGNVSEYALVHGQSRSCGCLAHEETQKRCYKHGSFSNPLYVTWCDMKNRCYYVKNNRYKNYGGRGITVCDEWRQDFITFYNWAIENGWQKGLTIDRIDVDGNYEPSNCRWISRSEQMSNRTNSRFLTFNGETKTLAEWARFTGLDSDTITMRLKRGWSVEDALTRPLDNRGRRK